jgi:hypothetical protein
LELAKCKLRKFITTNVPNNKLDLFIPIFESWIKSIAQTKALEFDGHDEIKETVVLEIKNKNLVSLFLMAN